MAQAVDEGVFPGGVLLVAKEAEVLFVEAFGHARLRPARTMTKDTVFDLASLTKPLATTLGLILLVQQEELRLDQTLESIVPEFQGTRKQKITVRELLSHTSGLPDYRPYYKILTKVAVREREGLVKKMLVTEALIYEPGKACLYSDIAFMILKWVFEVVAKKPLDAFAKDSLYGPLGLHDLFFVTSNDPLGKGNHLYAATEDCP
jgi:CubicO group peptidase (beta-lactamase class C family)